MRGTQNAAYFSLAFGVTVPGETVVRILCKSASLCSSAWKNFWHENG